jgi:hypothetical protein
MNREGRITAFQRCGDWLAHGWAIAVFENHDLGSRDVGRRFALPFSKADCDAMEIGTSRAPDTPQGLGWRYVLAAKPATADEAVRAIFRDEP